MYPIVMFVGRAGSGKDTAAKFWRDTTKDSSSISLAQPLKEFAKSVFEFTDEQLYGPSERRSEVFTLSEEQVVYNFHAHDWDFVHKYFGTHESSFLELGNWLNSVLAGPRTARHILQTLGTDFGRKMNRDVWIDAALKEADNVLTNGTSLVTISDGRFKNEVLKVKARGGIIVKIVDYTVATSLHQSETEQDSIPSFWYDSVIINNKALGLEHLRNQVLKSVRSLATTHYYD